MRLSTCSGEDAAFYVAYDHAVIVLAAALVLAAGLVVGDLWLAWWALGGGVAGVVAGLALAPLAFLVAHRIWLFASLLLWDGGSIRQAKRRLQEAKASRRRLATLRARAEIALLRRNRRM